MRTSILDNNKFNYKQTYLFLENKQCQVIN